MTTLQQVTAFVESQFPFGAGMPQQDDIYGLIVEVNQIWIALFKRERFQGDFPLPSYFVSQQTLSTSIMHNPIGKCDEHLPKDGPPLSCIALAIKICQEPPSGTIDELLMGTKYRADGYELWRLHNQFLPSAEYPHGFSFRLESLTIRAHTSAQRIFTMVAREKLKQMQSAIDKAQALFDKANDPQIDPDALKKALEDLNSHLRKVTDPITQAKELDSKTAAGFKKLNARIDALDFEDSPTKRKKSQKEVDKLSKLAQEAFNTLSNDDVATMKDATKKISVALKKFNLPDQAAWNQASENVKTASNELRKVFEQGDVHASSSSIIRIYNEKPLKTLRDLQLALVQIISSYVTEYDNRFPISDDLLENEQYREDLYTWFQKVNGDMPQELSELFDFINDFQEIQNPASKTIGDKSFYTKNLFKRYRELMNYLNPLRYKYLHLADDDDELNPDNIDETLDHLLGLLDLHLLRLDLIGHRMIEPDQIRFPLLTSSKLQSRFERQFLPLCSILLIEWSKTCDPNQLFPAWVDTLIARVNQRIPVYYKGQGKLDHFLFIVRSAEKQATALNSCQDLKLDTTDAKNFDYKQAAADLQTALESQDFAQIQASADFTDFIEKLDALIEQLDNMVHYKEFFEDLFQEVKTQIIANVDALKKLGFKSKLMADFGRLLKEASSQPKKQFAHANQSISVAYANVCNLPCTTSYEEDQRDELLKLLQRSQDISQPDFLEHLQKRIREFLSEVMTTPLTENNIQTMLQGTGVAYQDDRRELIQSLGDSANEKPLKIQLLRQIITSDLNRLSKLLTSRQQDRKVMQAKTAVEELKPELVLTEWLGSYNSIAPYVKWRGDFDPNINENDSHMPIGQS